MVYYISDITLSEFISLDGDGTPIYVDEVPEATPFSKAQANFIKAEIADGGNLKVVDEETLIYIHARGETV